MRHLASAKRIVLKVGSSLLAASPAGQPAAIADEIVMLQDRGIETVIVSSGAIALGLKGLGLDSRPKDLPSLQAAAAIGQSRLLQNWEHAFSAHQGRIAQILLTYDDVSNRVRFLNARHALRALLSAGVVPIVNENDTVAVDEIRYGDNDQLAALVCNLISADALIIYTDVDGLHDADPRLGGVRISLITDIDEQAGPVATSSSGSGVGSGGMASKVAAAKNAASFGVPTIVVPGARRGILLSALTGQDVGTLFVPKARAISSRKHWIGFGAKPAGQLVVDDGAYEALNRTGGSLLPAGLLTVHEEFDRGALVSLVTSEKVEFARGLVSYGATDLRKLCGCRSGDIGARLGYKYLDEVIHRDDLVLL
ncbi:MAG: glutamate 5-kinase [Myxococcales bacterium]|nr:glutamate 5-kinase [Myxococcales bacterium]